MSKFEKSQVAKSLSFDNSVNGFTSEDTQSAIEEVQFVALAAASPGFSWGRSGTINSGVWLQNESVPSNVTGRLVPINDPYISQIFVGNQDVGTYTIEIYEHEGDSINLTLLGSLTVTAARGASSSVNIPVTYGRYLAVLLSSGTAKNIVAGVIIKGSSI